MLIQLKLLFLIELFEELPVTYLQLGFSGRFPVVFFSVTACIRRLHSWLAFITCNHLPQSTRRPPRKPFQTLELAVSYLKSPYLKVVFLKRTLSGLLPVKAQPALMCVTFVNLLSMTCFSALLWPAIFSGPPLPMIRKFRKNAAL